ncbi:MAG: hypothetical protein B6I20_05045 [Bacteroidetes bacterium 4572_117]|nr:MAG: hypothetical protein B6I20_05045 [Bacteroidetes bacterium 4572_117]
MENKPNVWKNALNWGVIVGVVMVIYSLIMYFLDLSLEKWVGWVSYVLLIGGIVYSTIQYRDNVLGGAISYAQALGFGVLISLFAGIISGVYSYLLMAVIDPELIGKIMEMAQEQMLSQGLTDEQVEQAMEMQKGFMKPGVMALITIPSLTFMGFIFSLITSIFLKKEGANEMFDGE